MTPTMTSTMEEEVDNSINFLDITISKNDKKSSFNVYRKPTATDIIIPSDSCHITEQKLAAIRNLVNRLSTYPFCSVFSVAHVFSLPYREYPDSRFIPPFTHSTRKYQRNWLQEQFSNPL